VNGASVSCQGAPAAAGRGEDRHHVSYSRILITGCSKGLVARRSKREGGQLLDFTNRRRPAWQSEPRATR